MEAFSFRAMNTDILLAADGEPNRVGEGFLRAQMFIAESERRFTRFSDESELSSLNRAAGGWFRVSPDMLAVLSLALDCYGKTQHLFDPSVLPDLQRVGYDRSMDRIRAEGSAPLYETRTPRERIPFDRIQLNPYEREVFLPAGMRIDLGGIAKGWIAEQAAILLGNYARACGVDAGGDMFFVGHPDGLPYWQVGLEDPRTSGAQLTTLNVSPGAIATSSTTRRAWKQSGRQRHHLIDPRSGEPAVSDWLSVSVMTPHAYQAEVFAKALLIAGSREAEQIATHVPELSYLAVDRAGEIWGTQKSMEYIYVH